MFENKKIVTLKAKFPHVYVILHPFQINPEGPDSLYNEDLEAKVFEHKVLNLVLKHFGTIEGFEDLVNPAEENDLLTSFLFGGLSLSDTEKWYSLSLNGNSLN